MEDINACQHWLTDLLTTPSRRPTVDFFRHEIVALNLLRKSAKVILIAGTNGKGTTLMLLERILQQAGYRTGSFISPHLCELNERIRIDGATVSVDLFCQSFTAIKLVCNKEELHWFSFLLLVALHLFKQFPLDFLLIETGIGGKMCVTNALDPEISIVTTVSLDHMDLLGDTRELIGAQKAGIFRSHKPAICGDPSPPESIITYAKQVGASLYLQGRDFSYQQQGNSWLWQGLHKKFVHLPIPSLPLQNAATALAAITILSDMIVLNTEVIRRALATVFIPGRYQIVAQKPTIICDVAHNPQAVTYLSAQLQQKYFMGKTFIVFACKRDRAIISILQSMTIPVAAWFIAELPQQRGFVSVAKAYLQQQSAEVHVASNVLGALEKAKAMATEDDRIVVFGSFKAVGQILYCFPKQCKAYDDSDKEYFT